MTTHLVEPIHKEKRRSIWQNSVKLSRCIFIRVTLCAFCFFVVISNLIYPPDCRVYAKPNNQSTATNGINFKNLSTEDGLSNNSVQAIIQDTQGFMWFGTLDGLNKYDGYEFRIFRHNKNSTTSLGDNNVLSLYEDSSGYLWIGTASGLDRLDRETGNFIHYQLQLPDPNNISEAGVQAILKDRSGRLWVGTKGGGLYQYNNRKGLFIPYRHRSDNPNTPSNNDIRCLYEDVQGNLWIGTADGLDRLDPKNGAFLHFKYVPDDPSSLSSDFITSISGDLQGNLWIGTMGGGVDRLDLSSLSFIHYFNIPEDTTSISGNIIWAVYHDQSGKLWLGTNVGLDLLDSNQQTFIHYDPISDDPYSVQNTTVTDIFEDRSGVLWLANRSRGLSIYSPGAHKFNHYQYQPETPDGLSSNAVFSILYDNQGYLWIGTFGGGLNRMIRETGITKTYRHNPNDPHSLISDDVYAIFEDHLGGLWVGTNAGLDLFDRTNDRFIHFLHDPQNPNSLTDNQVRAIIEDRFGDLWVGTANQGLNRVDLGRKIIYRYQNNQRNEKDLGDDHIMALFEDHKGKIWVGTWSGISVFDPYSSQFTHYRHSDTNPGSLSSNMVLTFDEDAAGNIWIGTSGGGLDYFDRNNQIFTHFTTQEGLADDVVYGILTAPDGTLWLSTKGGISHFDPSTVSFRNYDINDGLQDNDFNPGSHYKSKLGEMFFGGMNGFNSFYPQQVKDNLQIPPIVITNLALLNQVIKTDIVSNEHYLLSYKDYFISFDFAALDYTAPDKNQYAYMLEGVDKNWIYTSSNRRIGSLSNEPEGTERDYVYTSARRSVTYTSLKEGEYTFRVKGSNNDGVWNDEGIAISFTIVPPFWKTQWFQAGIAFLVIAGVVGGYAIRIRSLRIQRRDLETQVQERTSEIEQRRQVAEGLRDVLAIINSNQPLEDILEFILVQASELLGTDVCVLIKVDQPQQYARIQAAYHLPDELEHIDCFSIKADEVTRLIMNGLPYIHDGFSRPLHPDVFGIHEPDKQWKAWQEITDRLFNTFLAVPINVRGEVYGFLACYFVFPQPLMIEKNNLASAFADQAALAIENANLRLQAERTAIVAERNRLARDLHDAVTQTLFAASLIADVLPRMWERNPDQAKLRLGELRELTTGALAEMRTLLLELRPSTLMEAALADLLRQLAEAFTGRARIPVDMDILEEALAPVEVKIALYRIAQEALNNVAKHAGNTCTKVSLTLHSRSDEAKLRIYDNGCGFNVWNISPDHLGLGIMNERAESINAVLSINSRIGMGTEILVHWKAQS